MKKIRIGNDIYVAWQIFGQDSVPYNLVGKSLVLDMRVHNPESSTGETVIPVTNFSVTYNTLYFTFWGVNQTLQGLYILKLRENIEGGGQKTLDTKEAFTLVGHSWDQSDDDSGLLISMTSFVGVGLRGEKGDKGDQGDKGDTGDPGIETASVTVDATTGTPSATATITNKNLALSFSGIKGEQGIQGVRGPKGDQGNTGSSVDYPYELVNNLTTDDSTKGLTAAMGKQVGDNISQLGQEVNGAEVPLFEVGGYDEWITGRYLVASTGSPNTSSVNSVTDYIDITGYQQIKTIVNRTSAYSSSTGIICFYNSEKQYLNAAILGDVGERGHKDIVSDIPVGTKYIRCTCFNTELSSWYLTGIVKAKDYLTEDAVGASISYLTTDKMVIGYYRKASDGSPSVMSSAVYSLPIAVSAGDRVVLRNAGVSSAYALITRVTETGDVISVIQTGLSGDSSLKDYDILIDFNGFISVSCDEFSARRVVLYKAGIHDTFARQVSEYETRILTVENETNRLADVVAPKPIQLTEDDVIEDKYRNISGALSTLSGYIYSVPILVKRGTRIITTEAVNIAYSVSVITKVDSENGFIETLVAGTGESTIYDYSVQEDCYIGISCYGLRYPLFRILVPDIKAQIDNISANSILVDGRTKLPALNAENPLAVILRECGYGCLLKTWGFIGDSYTSGETPAYDGSTMKFLDCYKWSWGQQFMNIIGSEGYNFSNGGQTAKGWIRSQGTVHDDTYYGGVGGGDWRHAQVDLKQGYIISLGINDKGHFGQTYLGATYSLGDVTADVNVSDYTQNNENTFAGCYAGIIQRILSVQPRAKIFCITQFQDTLEQVNDVVREIVSLFPNNVFLIDLHDYALNIVSEPYYMSNGHPSPLGYAYMAYCINTYVDYIIRNQKQKFMDVTLIGSSYTL